ncbi:hypothetical protein U9R90_00360 [Streptomyces sp. E11-3]|uniref:hypothetical protein n=1 Tax=Streptomyces sp. E11-3 TaxID=3110112 RepID=UPI0039813446
MRRYVKEHGDYPTARQFGHYLMDVHGVVGRGGGPLTESVLRPYLRDVRARSRQASELTAVPGEYAVTTKEREPRDGAVAGEGEGAEPADRIAETEAHPLIEPLSQEPEPLGSAGALAGLRVSDRYYLAWASYVASRGSEPNGEELSQYLAGQGIVGRNGHPVDPSTLRRYLLSIRLYAVWDCLREKAGGEPSVSAVVDEAARRGITGRRGRQYNAPITAEILEAKYLDDFRRRHAALAFDRDDTRS